MADPKSDPATEADFAAMDAQLGIAEGTQPVPETETPEVEIETDQKVTVEDGEVTVEAPEPPDPEDAAEPAEEPTASEQLLAGKYKTPEELERAYRELQQLQGRSSQELGELRKAVERIDERIPEEPEGYVPMDDSTVNWFDTLVEENPVGAMEWARKNDPSGSYYARGMDAWFDTAPRAAATYQLAIVTEGLRNEFTTKLSETTDPLNKQAIQQDTTAAWQQAAAELPDLADHADAILEEAKASPEILRGAQSVEDRRQAIHKLYRLVKGAQATSLETVQSETQAAEAQASKAAKQAGSVATPSTVAQAEKADPNQSFYDEFDRFAARHSG